MSSGGVRSAFEALLAAEPDVADRDEVAAMVRRSRQVQSWLDAVNVACARRSGQLASSGRAEPAESLLNDEGQRSSKEALVITQRTHACDAMPAFEAALAAGAISGGHVDAVARTIRQLDDEIRPAFIDEEANLLIAATRERIEMFASTCRDTVRRLVAERDRRTGADTEAMVLEQQRAASRIKQWTNDETGMFHTHVEIDPIRGTKLKKALDDLLGRARRRDGNAGTPWNQLEVDSFVDAVALTVTRKPTLDAMAPHGTEMTETGTTQTTAPTDASCRHCDDAGPVAELRVPEVLVLIDQATMVAGWHEHSICETSDGIPVPISEVRRLCCDAEIIPVVLNGRGEVTDLGRSERTVSRAQRRSLRAMHKTCVGHGCQVPFERCQIHHIVFWRFNGETNIDNLVPVCSKHHHLAHEGGWSLTMTPDRIITWTRPDGTIHWSGTSIDRAPQGVRPKRTDRRQPRRTDRRRSATSSR